MCVCSFSFGRTKSINESRLLEEYDRLVRNLADVGHLDEAAVESLANPVLPADVVQEVVRVGYIELLRVQQQVNIRLLSQRSILHLTEIQTPNINATPSAPLQPSGRPW